MRRFGGCATSKKAESGAKDTSKTGAAGVPYLTLNNGVKMPQFGIGTFNLGTDEVVYNSVLTALREGYRHIDTAHAYRAELGVGRAVKQFCEESGVPRSEIWVTSKVWPTEYGEGVTLPAIDRMLERMQLDYLDLLYIHQPAGDYFGAWKDMEKAVELGKVRTLGISDFDYNDTMFDDFMAKAGTKPAIIQLECHPYAQRLDMRKKIAEHGMILECWFPWVEAARETEAFVQPPSSMKSPEITERPPRKSFSAGIFRKDFPSFPAQKIQPTSRKISRFSTLP